MTKTVTLKELRPSLPRVIRDVHTRMDRYVVTRRGKPVAVMMGIDDLEALLETLDILSDRRAVARLRKAEDDIRKGRTRSWEDVRAELDRL